MSDCEQVSRRRFLRQSVGFSALAGLSSALPGFARLKEPARQVQGAHHALILGDWGRDNSQLGQRAVAAAMQRYHSPSPRVTLGFFFFKPEVVAARKIVLIAARGGSFRIEWTCVMDCRSTVSCRVSGPESLRSALVISPDEYFRLALIGLLTTRLDFEKAFDCESWDCSPDGEEAMRSVALVIVESDEGVECGPSMGRDFAPQSH